MSSEWRHVRIDEIADVVGGGTPKTGEPDYWDGDIGWISPRDLSSHSARYISRGARSITARGLHESSAQLLPAGTVLVSSRAPIGYVAIAEQPLATNQGFKSLVLGQGCLPEFYYYVMSTMKPMMEAVAGGSTFKEISGRVMKALVVPHPPLDEQRAIAEVLGSIDDRIEWCKALASQLLELTRAHHRLRCEASSKSVSIGDCAAVYFGAPYDSAQFNTKRIGKPLIRIRDIDALDASVYTTQTHRAEVQIAPGDIVVGMDGEFRAHLWRGPLAVLNQRVCTFRPVDPNRTVDLLHALEEPLKISEASISGTTVSHLGKRHIDDFILTMPSESSGSLMEATAKIALLGSEIRMLTEMRRALLSHLVSGDVRIQNPERLIGQVQ